MENAIDALKIAAAVLIFIIAISSSFSLFGTAKQTADSIITMRDKQAYLDAAELDGGILYTSASEIKGEDITADKGTESSIGGVTINGDRIVTISDIISTIYRYSKEKYGVTIVKSTGEVLVRYDSNTERVMSIWNSVKDDAKTKYAIELKYSTRTIYVEPEFTETILEKLYEITIPGNSSIKCGAPWYGNENEIQKRIACDLNGAEYKYNNQKYTGENLLNELDGKKIVEVINEIDQSKYLEADSQDTDLLQQYEMPTVEIVYIILN